MPIYLTQSRHPGSGSTAHGVFAFTAPGFTGADAVNAYIFANALAAPNGVKYGNSTARFVTLQAPLAIVTRP